MKKLTILAPGPLKHKFVADGLLHYQRLIQKFATLEVKLPRLKGNFSDPDSRKKEEEKLLWREIEKLPRQKRFLIVLDEKGICLKIYDFAKFLEDRFAIDKELVFVVGGPEGISESLKEKADCMMSLSHFTLNHELALLVLAEALFRALSLIKGHPYHR